MPSISNPPETSYSNLDNFGLIDFDDLHANSPPSKKFKGSSPAANLGIDEEVAVTKRARAPAVKLDEQRLLSAAGIPRLRSQAHKLKIKGKGHEFSDAARLLSFYQLWLDDLFPKARFLDALAMVEKLGHKKSLIVARSEWINEDNPESSNQVEQVDDFALDPDNFANDATTQQAQQQMPDVQGLDSAQDFALPPQTPPRADVPDDDDLYDATPLGQRRAGDTNSANNEALTTQNVERENPSDALPINTLQSRPLPPATDQDVGDDDLEAMIAEAEKVDGGPAVQQAGEDFADEEEVMRDF
ncbi:hypothetical protein CDD81_1281 [Ophiocordyceps australis]|uniref:Chromosome segregation in meiosis protein n=1 Tax=Ophiocordyceps australis TaxID=1399860 RepID=A0A2C5XZC7_9HYPO|nr:hypothetical protein CDD81_1281 [Ophiocordyceps australis]